MPEPDERSTSTRQTLLLLTRQLALVLRQALTPDQVAEAYLRRGGETHPWTEEAQRVWEQTDSGHGWQDHHLAVLHHSRAYDLENEGSDDAFAHWERALAYWARVYRDDGFWTRIHRHLVEHMGVPVDVDVVEAVRARLPYDLLAPHVALAARYRLTDPGRACHHMRLIVRAPFPADVVAAVREAAVRDVLEQVPDAVQGGRIEEALDLLESWLRTDPTNPHLVRALLFVNRSSLEPRWVTWDDRAGLAQIAESLRRVTRLLEPALPRTASVEDPALASELARYEYWQGLVVLDEGWKQWSGRAPDSNLTELDQVLIRGGEAAQHFERALQLDSAIVMDDRYSALPGLYLDAVKLVAWSVRDRGQDGRHAEWRAAAQCLQRALELNPPDGRLDSLLDQLIDGPPDQGLEESLDSSAGYDPGLEYWLGLAALREARARFSPEASQEELAATVLAGQRAVRQFQLAVWRDRRILRDNRYQDVREVRAAAETITGRALLHLDGQVGDNPLHVVKDHFRRAIELDPANFEPHLYLASALARDTGRTRLDFDEAIRALQQAHRLVPGPAPPRFREVVTEIRSQLGLRWKAQ